jgi:hypothetical protein
VRTARGSEAVGQGRPSSAEAAEGRDSPDELDLMDGLEDVTGGGLSFLVFASAVSCISEKLKRLFRTD